MERTRSGFLNANGNANPNQWHVIDHAPKVAAAPEPIIVAGVQAMIQLMLDRQMEETRHLLQNNKDEPTIPIEQPELNEGQ